MDAAATQALNFAAKFAALGHEARLSIMRLLLSAHPLGMVVGEIQEEIEIPSSTLSHHLDALQREALVSVEREGKFLRYRADTNAVTGLVQFLYAECCRAVKGAAR